MAQPQDGRTTFHLSHQQRMPGHLPVGPTFTGMPERRLRSGYAAPTPNGGYHRFDERALTIILIPFSIHPSTRLNG